MSDFSPDLAPKRVKTAPVDAPHAPKVRGSEVSWIFPTGVRTFITLRSPPRLMPLMRRGVDTIIDDKEYAEWLEHACWTLKTKGAFEHVRHVSILARCERTNDDAQLVEKLMAITDALVTSGVIKPELLIDATARWALVQGCRVSIDPAPQSLVAKAGAA